MSFTLTKDQIIQLAPDAASVKAAQGQQKPAKWSGLGISQRALFGYCQGSGKNPYKTAVDIQNLAFKCSCPSRKFPCKHALALMLMYNASPDLFTETEENDFVKDWLSKRQESAEKKAAKAAENAAKPVDEKAKAKRLAKRVANVTAGVDDMQLMIRDLLRTGLIASDADIESRLRNAARRMTDAQAPGLTLMLNDLVSSLYDTESIDDRYTKICKGLGRIYLLCESFRNIEAQSEDMQNEIRARIGFTQSKEELTVNPPFAESFFCIGKSAELRDTLTAETYYLYLPERNSFAYILNYISKYDPNVLNIVPGKKYEGKLYAYPGAGILPRLHCSESILKDDNSTLPEGAYCSTLQQAVKKAHSFIIANPLSDKAPVLIKNVTLFRKNKDQYYLCDVQGDCIRIKTDKDMFLKIMSATGGAPCSVMSLVKSDGFTPINVMFDDCMISAGKF